jgi:hypothetical protein
MQLALMVAFIVLGITAMLGVVGLLIDKSAQRHERHEDR